MNGRRKRGNKKKVSEGSRMWGKEVRDRETGKKSQRFTSGV